MKNENGSSQEKQYIKTKESIINNLYAQKETEKQYLNIVDNLLGYWIKELKKTSYRDKERQNQLMELINTERGTIKKIGEDIDRINEMIDKTEKNLEKIRGMVSSLRKER